MYCEFPKKNDHTRLNFIYKNYEKIINSRYMEWLIYNNIFKKKQ